MTTSSLESLLPPARADELRAGRWLAAALAGLALVHVFAVAPFVAAAQRRIGDRADLERLAAVAAELAALEPHVTGPARAADEVMGPALGRLVEDVRGDMVRLRATYAWLRAFVAAQRGDGEVAGETAEDVEVFPVENVDRILAVAEASTPEELLAALGPVVERHVSSPRFSYLRELWRSQAQPRVEASLDAVAGGLPELRGRWAAAATADAAAPAWDELGAALAAARRTVRDLEWRAPERADWWTSAPPEGGELLSLRPDPAVEEQLRRPLAVDQLRVALTRAEVAFRAVAAAVGSRREELSGKDGAGGISGVASRVGTVARGYPLVIGLVLAAALVAAARRRRELGWIARLLIERGDEALGHWYFARGRVGVASGLPEREPAAAARAEVVRIVLLGVLGLGWIGLTAYQLWELEPRERLLAVTAIGAAAFLAAVIYDAAVARGLHRLLAPEKDEPAPAEPVRQFFEDDQGVLDVHTLRR